MTGCYIIDPHNLGDQVCCPLDYFPEWVTVPRANCSEWESTEGLKVFGGGGIFHPGLLDILARISRNPKGKLVVWGAGINLHGHSEMIWPQFLQGWDLIGLRDFGNPWEYVPCASCLHPAFNAIPEPLTDVVAYEHHKHPLSVGLHTMNNDQPKEAFQDVIGFLASGRVVLTNTFHGAYWALLLGRKVVVMNPFSNRFLGFRPHIEFCNESNWRDVVDREPQSMGSCGGYLEECVALNMGFKNKVAEL